MPTLDPNQSAAIADSITALGAAVNDYLNNHNVSVSDYAKLDKLQSTLTALGAQWEQQAAQTEYDDTAAAFTQLSKATTAVDAAAAQLGAAVANISKVAAIVGTVASFASALGGGVAGPILAAAQKVITAAQ